MKPVASSRDYQRLSIRTGGEFRSKNTIDNPEFDRYGYIPSKNFVRNKKQLVIQEEKFNKNKRETTARKKLQNSIKRLMNSMEKEIFKYKK